VNGTLRNQAIDLVQMLVQAVVEGSDSIAGAESLKNQNSLQDNYVTSNRVFLTKQNVEVAITIRSRGSESFWHSGKTDRNESGDGRSGARSNLNVEIKRLWQRSNNAI
jgi:hypothetical protein